jgi:GT2 family glycosyltransferase
MVTLNCIIPSALKKEKLHYIRHCVKSLEKASPRHFKVNIFIVSENATFKSPLFKNDPHVHFLFCPKNTHGFSGMNNFAFHKTVWTYPSDYYLLINDDAWVEDTFFAELKKILARSSGDVIVPMVKVPESEQCSTFGVEYLRSGFARDAIDEKMDTQLVSAACVFFKTSFLKKLHRTYGFFFNPLLSYYLEDVELSLRIVCLNAKIEKYLKLRVRHHGSVTSGKKSYFVFYQTFRNLLWLIIMDWPLLFIFRHFLSILAVQFWLITRSGIRMYLYIAKDTLFHLPQLIKFRQRTVGSYPSSADFSKVFSEYTWRTVRKNTPIRFP